MFLEAFRDKERVKVNEVFHMIYYNIAESLCQVFSGNYFELSDFLNSSQMVRIVKVTQNPMATKPRLASVWTMMVSNMNILYHSAPLLSRTFSQFLTPYTC